MTLFFAWLILLLSPYEEPDFRFPVFVSISDTPWRVESLGKRVEQQYGIPASRFLFSALRILPRPQGRKQPYKSARGVVFTPDGGYVANYIQLPRGVEPEEFMRQWISVAARAAPDTVKITKFGSRYLAAVPLKGDPLRKFSKSEAVLSKDIFWSGADFNPTKLFPEVPATVLGSDGFAISFDIKKVAKSKSGSSFLRAMESSLNRAQQRRDQEPDSEYGVRHTLAEIRRAIVKTLSASKLAMRLRLPDAVDSNATLQLDFDGTSRREKRSTLLRSFCDDNDALISAHCLLGVPPKSAALLANQKFSVTESRSEQLQNVILTFARTHGCVDLGIRLEEEGGRLVLSGGFATGMSDDEAMKALANQFDSGQTPTSGRVEATVEGVGVVWGHRDGHAWFAVARDREAAVAKLKAVLSLPLRKRDLTMPSFLGRLDGTGSKFEWAHALGKMLPSLTADDLAAIAFTKLKADLDLSTGKSKWRARGRASDELVRLMTVIAFRRLIGEK